MLFPPRGFPLRSGLEINFRNSYGAVQTTTATIFPYLPKKSINIKIIVYDLVQSANTIQAKRESTSILLLLILFFSLLRPISPFIANGIGHTFFSESHHSKLHQNGYDHIDADLQKLASTDQTETGKVPVSTFSIETAFTFITEIPQLLSFQNSTIIIYQQPLGSLREQSAKPEIQPPDLTFVSLSRYAS